MIKGLSNMNDSALIGFVSDCLCSGAITIQEAHQWVYHMIEKYDELPPYMYYLMETRNYKCFYESIGFSVYSDLTNDEDKALTGLSYIRKPEKKDGDSNISKKAALNALKRNPQIIDRFRETFPFIELTLEGEK